MSIPASPPPPPHQNPRGAIVPPSSSKASRVTQYLSYLWEYLCAPDEHQGRRWFSLSSLAPERGRVREFVKAGRLVIVSGVFELRMTCRKIAKKARQSLDGTSVILTMHRERHG